MLVGGKACATSQYCANFHKRNMIRFQRVM